MAWVATLVDKNAQTDGSVKLVVQYVNGPRSVQKEYTFFGDFDIQNVVYNEINNFTSIISTYQSLTVNNSVVGIAPSVISGGTKQQFFTNLGRLNQYQNLVTLGVISSVQSDYTALKTSVATGFNNTYI